MLFAPATAEHDYYITRYCEKCKLNYLGSSVKSGKEALPLKDRASRRVLNTCTLKVLRRNRAA